MVSSSEFRSGKIRIVVEKHINQKSKVCLKIANSVCQKVEYLSGFYLLLHFFYILSAQYNEHFKLRLK